MDIKLLFQALTKFLIGVVIYGLLIFLPAGSFQYWQGWLMMWVLFLPILFSGISMLLNNPELLRKRLSAKEEQKEQKWVVAMSTVIFVAAFVVAGLNWRFQWLLLPEWAVWAAAAFYLLGYSL